MTDQFANGDPTHDAQKSEDPKRGTVTGALALGANPPVRMGPVLVLDKLRDLDLDAPPSPGRKAQLSAASGLVKRGDYLLISPDDENHLGIFAAVGNEPGALLRVFPGDLPRAHDARKAAKPDLEALAFLDPVVSKSPHGALSRGRSLTDLLIGNTRIVELGEVAGVPLSFTDATPLSDGRIVFAASAEASENTYEDGEVAGSAVGILDAEGHVERLHPLSQTVKVEGVDANLTANGDIDLLLVTDGDDPLRPGELFAARLST